MLIKPVIGITSQTLRILV